MLSITEKQFIRNQIQNGYRIDNRRPDEESEIIIKSKNLVKADGYIYLIQGNSEIEISIQNLINKEEQENISSEIDDFIDNNIENENEFENNIDNEEQNAKTLEKKPVKIIFNSKSYNFINKIKNIINCDVKINLNVIKDDGNIFSLFVFGLNLILKKKNIEYYDIYTEASNKEHFNENNILCKRYALIDSIIIIDPIKMEEESSDCIIDVLYQDKKVKCYFIEGMVDNTKIENILNKILEE
ncbi:hypothetical protein SLOPH_2187 [Spraguea lophii 42_110]|uniref:Uncharacterized protein n=1 Tax=Spraguea lophii (strain 42_110) TaxID=1358809 RepID=S7W7S3_SPRLO|nr:hypothetical protein SLOPH_2187 [Spraguea lophii 42_110]